ncbi:MAG: sel1 repeat family protein [Alphaproteobacteria bacterium]|nr:sel1 repeat family protein [Alphaproteobacteria bacterium]
MKTYILSIFNMAVLTAAMLCSVAVAFAPGFSLENFQESLRDFSPAEVKKWRVEAERGDAEAQVNLGMAYWVGNGIDQNSREGVRWWRTAAEKGNADAQLMLGLAYFAGVGVIGDVREGYIWLTIASVNGNETAVWALHEPYMHSTLLLNKVEVNSAKKEAEKRLEEIDRRKAQNE